MGATGRSGRALAALVAVATVGLTACGDERPAEPPSATAAAGASPAPAGDPLARQGPPAAWSRSVATGEHQVAVIGDTVVVTDEGVLLGLDLASGDERWRRDLTEGARLQTADDLVVLEQGGNGPLEVVDPATGAVRWRAERRADDWGFVVRQEGIYTGGCADRSTDPPGDCAIKAHDVRDGKELWTLPDASFQVVPHAIGGGGTEAPSAGSYLVAGVAPGEKGYAAVDVRTGRPLRGRVEYPDWYLFAAGGRLITTDNEPAGSQSTCAVDMLGFDAATGLEAWATTVRSGRREDGTCQTSFVAPDLRTDRIIIGAGSRVATIAEGGRPQLLDLKTGRAVWESDTPGVPIDGNDRSILLRSQADEGEISVLDFGTGQLRWSAPDPGLSGQSASWATAVTGRLVAVNGAVGDRPIVLVYDALTGQQLGRFRSWLAGAGDGWVAVTHGDGSDRLTLEFVRFP